MIYVSPTIGLAMPTDQEWGRLYKFDDTGDSGLVMPPRSYYFRDFNIGQWADLAIGLIYNAGASTGDTDNVVDERQLETQIANLFHFGLSKSTGGYILVDTNPVFLGLRGILGGVTQISESPLQIGNLRLTCRTQGHTQIASNNIQIPLSQGVSGTPYSIIGLRFIRNEITGLIQVSYDTDTNIALADDDANISTLTDFLRNIPSEAEASFRITNLVDFRTFYLYWPYIENRLKLHCVGAIKIS